ncbi:N-acetylmuramoyl-L-alanine amidase [Granulicella sp. S156]|uniref:N-acetylmuramoyl-L-alanine amidase n=1 Tax=Granulicella sp. S156 TaxID=1747224 RepID=UPI00131EB459|nr:N-acetylmuramoyl-L-alanine amidase [Granulicella sp. S156]
MGALSQRWVVQGRCAVCVAAITCVCFAGLSSAAVTARAKSDPWQSALAARQAFEAEPSGTHTKAEYANVMDGFRAIYHGDPANTHAAKAVEQVAELLAEQGHELGDRKSLRDAAGQYEFLAKAYPSSTGGSLAPSALGHALELLGPDGVNDAAEARKVRAELESQYPRFAKSEEARSSHPGGDETVASIDRPASTAGNDRTTRLNEQRTVSTGSGTSDTRFSGDSATTKTGRSVLSADVETIRAETPVVKPVSLSGSKHVAQVTGIRHWSTSTYTRVAIDLGDEVEYQAARVENPDRIFFDLHNSHLASELAGKSFAVTDDGFLTRIRAAQFSNDVTRVVLDVHEVAEYSAFLLPNPYRLIIDIHGKQGVGNSKEQGAGVIGAGVIKEQGNVAPPANSKQQTGNSDEITGNRQQRSASLAPVAPVAPAPSTVSSGSNGVTEVSGLPPMPVTDGSSAFGLSSRKTAGNSTVAQPRVVIPTKPTTANPVPNTVTTHSSDTGVEFAAVSDQPGKVVATSRPTSQPIVDRTPPKSKPPVSAAPVEAPPPTADGETLVRALGLKIGRIVIDAGHGGHDSGTLGVGGIEEKDVVLDVALRLGKLLHDRLGAEIVYTRADDTFIPLETRTAIANKAQADLFISVHANSSQDSTARGVEVYYLNFTSDPDAMRVASRENAVSTQSVHELSDLVKKIALKDKIDESHELATDVDAGLYAGLAKGNDGLKNRGVKKAPFVVLIGANMPSILAEISFVTNPTDAEQLQRPQYRQRVAESLYNGVARYAAGINGSKAGAPKTTERAQR